MFCKECGANIGEESVNFCPECGLKIPETSSKITVDKETSGKTENEELIVNEKDKKLVGVEGWLAFFTLGLIITAGFSAYNAWSYFTLAQGSLSQYSGQLTPLILLFAANFALQGFLLYNILKKKLLARKLVMYMFLFNCFVAITDVVIVSGLYQSVNVAVPSDAYNNVSRSISYLVVWGLYFYKSKRVKLTLVNE